MSCEGPQKLARLIKRQNIAIFGCLAPCVRGPREVSTLVLWTLNE